MPSGSATILVRRAGSSPSATLRLAVSSCEKALETLGARGNLRFVTPGECRPPSPDLCCQGTVQAHRWELRTAKKPQGSDEFIDHNAETRDVIIKSGLSGVAATVLVVTMCSPGVLGGMIGTSLASSLGFGSGN